MMLIAYSSFSPVAGMVASQSQKVAALWMVMPFSRSSSMLSIFAPTLSRPRTYRMPKSSKWPTELVIHACKDRTHLVNLADTPSIV